MAQLKVMHLDGVAWVEKGAYDQVVSALQEKQRSKASHNRYFAHIIDMYHNLPMHHSAAPYAASENAFRKHGLIVRGYCDTDILDVENHEVALRTAPIIGKHARREHGYALITVKGSIITCSTPHSQSFKAMGKDEFHASVAAVEGWAEELLGVSV